jgi:glucosamine-6-phosphate deaminase
MKVNQFETKEALGKAAAEKGAALISRAISERGSASIIVATGTSQFEMLGALVDEQVDWSRVTAFHLDEYIGIPLTHPASFRRYLKERFVERVPLKAFHYINGEVDSSSEVERLNILIAQHSIDVAFVGIGENGHLAFNDPPADFETKRPYIVVELDQACRMQQMGEGWFSSIEEVPRKAISMSVRQIMKSTTIICSVPDERKARAVKNSLEEAVSPQVPASVLTTHSSAWLYLDQDSSSLLKRASSSSAGSEQLPLT